MGKMQNIGSLFSDSKTRLMVILTFVFLGGAILIAMMSGSRNKVPGPSSTAIVQAGPGQISSVPFTSKATPEYERTLESQNIKQAQQAEKTGNSAIPTITRATDMSQCQPETVTDVTRGSWQQGLGFSGLSRVQQVGGFQPRELSPNVLGIGAGGSMFGANTQIIGPDGKVLGTVNANGQLIGPDGKVIGTINANGQLIGPDGKVLATIGPNGQLVGPDGSVIGKMMASNQLIGPDGKVIGTIGTDGQVIGLDGKPLGTVAAYRQVIGPDGKLLGTIGPDGQFIDPNGKVIGNIGPDGRLMSPDGKLLGTIGPNGQLLGPDGKVMGTLATSMQLRGPDGQLIATVGPNGQLLSANGRVVGSIGAASVPASSQSAVATTQAATTLSPAMQQRNAAQQRQMEQINAQKLQQQMTQIQNGMTAQANQLFSAWSPPAQSYVAGNSNQQGAVAGATGSTAGAGGTAGTASGGAAQGPPLVKAGTIMFAVLVTAVNTDEPGPIMAKIVDGPFKGGVLLGGLTPQNQKVMLTFNVVNLPSAPKSIPVNAVAIDENTARTGLSSYTNNHYVLRYGTLFASSFLQGYGQAVTSAGSTISTSVVGNTQTMPNLSPKGTIVSALGNVGTKWGAVAAGTFSTPPTVYVNSGTGMGILFMQDVQPGS